MSSLAAAVGRAIGVVDSGPILPTWSPQSSPGPGSDSPPAFCRAEEMLRASAGAGRIVGADPGARWVNVVETGTAPPSVFVPINRMAAVGRVQ